MLRKCTHIYKNMITWNVNIDMIHLHNPFKKNYQ